MPNVKTHMAISYLRTGRTFEDLHRWIDEYQEKLGSEHRSRRHYWSRKTMRFIKSYYDRRRKGLGKIAVEEWLFHIVLDNLSTLYRYQRKNKPMSPISNTYLISFMDKNFIKYYDDNLSDKRIEQLFKKIHGKKSMEIKEFNNEIEHIFED